MNRPGPRLRLPIPNLLAVILGAILLSGGAAHALLDEMDNVFCTNAGSGGAACDPGNSNGDLDFGNSLFDYDSGSDTWFDVTFTDSTVKLTFTAQASGNFGSADVNVLLLDGIEPEDSLEIVIDSVTLTGFTNDPSEMPTAGPGFGGQEIRWDLVGTDPTAGAMATINLSFVPEPGTGLLLASGLLGLAAHRRARASR